MPKFTYKGKEYDYVDMPHNETILNERCIELSLAKSFLKKFKNVMEIGAVTPYYYEEYKHKVFDLTDNHPRSKKCDARELDIKGKDVLCLSTVEHFGDNTIPFIQKVIDTCPHYLITFPLGYSEDVDLDIWALENNVRYMARKGDGWEERTVDDLDIRYGPRWANTVVVIENCL